MAAITATSWTETLLDRFIEGKERTSYVQLALSVTAGYTYPSSGGMPLPTSLGMKRNVGYVNIVQYLMVPSAAAAAAAYPMTYDKDNHSVRAYYFPSAGSGVTGLQELPTTWSPSEGFAAEPRMVIQVKGW